MSPKTCSCGKQALVIDSRQHDGCLLRRYLCSFCERRWSTVELRVEEGINHTNVHDFLIKSYSLAGRELMADRLIEMAQELLR